MPIFEYKVVPAPARGLKARGVKTPEARFANALETLMNSMGADGWDYQRADILPNEERVGLRGSQTVYRSMLVFRRPLDAGLDEPRDTPQVVPAEPSAEPPETDDGTDTEDAPQSLWSHTDGADSPDAAERHAESHEDTPLTRA